MRVVGSPEELGGVERAVAIGTFDGVHVGHRRTLEAAVSAGPTPTAVTFHPHPRVALGYHVELICSLDRRLELIAESGIEEALVVEFTSDVASLEPEDFAQEVLSAIGTRVVVAGEDFRFGRRRRGDLDLLRGLGFEVEPVQLVEGVSSSTIRQLVGDGEVAEAARPLGRPFEVEGIVVAGDARGGTLGFPTANLSVDPDVLVPGFGIYAGAVGEHRAATSIGLNPHYGGSERRIEAFLLDYEGDLYGKRLRLELWQRLRDERAFGSEAELIEQIALDVAATREATRPV